ncbi:hypothetical protein [Pseudomonas fluorescens]|uniref:hypothetical protein n=1 Tax=Pseudomonas fluorescens TaxID=294 RepID=UPI0015E17392|nr:hypothetical protein [Pseudomonas fluorescens]
MTTDVLETSTVILKKVASNISIATADRTPKNIVLEEDLTVYLGGVGMTGGYIYDQ